ncbi:hypothetical protein [Vibrio paucivorans]|uniref:Uncharacterized protein n=1 Tax=Vibrio paucivorans TaxID=2829489 RepID=A0A9X3CES5_9VIBR|nr:hypothetical protein [Vibrio paucivorans]MCW8334443.1 hypothetical protein [Vibrio paucivorans]
MLSYISAKMGSYRKYAAPDLVIIDLDCILIKDFERKDFADYSYIIKHVNKIGFGKKMYIGSDLTLWHINKEFGELDALFLSKPFNFHEVKESVEHAVTKQ